MNKKRDKSFYLNNVPVKLTEAGNLKIHSEYWGLLTEYYLESVKITNHKGVISSTATLRIGDRSGQVTCVIHGPSVGLLFGLSVEEWIDVQQMCNCREQLFYRYFKNGINNSFHIEQKIFYNFCMNSQKHEILVAKFRKCVNTRNKFRSDSLLQFLELQMCDNSLLDLYVEQLRSSANISRRS